MARLLLLLLSGSHTMDQLSTLKGRIGEALVETVLRQAFYKVSRLGRESQLQHMFKSRKGEFLPDFLVWKRVGTSSEGAPLHRILCVEVKYRANVQEYLRQFGAELLSDIGEDWPELYVIFVTDHPDEARSCFQLLHLGGSNVNAPLTTIDLHEARALGIGKDIVETQTQLVTQIFSLLRLSLAEKDPPRKAPVKLSVPAAYRRAFGTRKSFEPDFAVGGNEEPDGSGLPHSNGGSRP